jgi:hypothetical protein
MNIREISKPVTAKSLNESLAKRFGQKINLEAFTLEQLQDSRNRIRTKLSQVETNESFDTVVKDEGYQKSKLFLDVLNAAIAEREDVAEAAKPDYIDIDGDGNKKEPMKKAAKDAKKKKAVKEGAEDQAELVMAAKDMVDRLTGWMEDTAEMQTESMLELADAIRDEMGAEQSEQFVNSVKPALESLYAAMETTRTSLTQGVGLITGESAPEVPMGGEEAPLDIPAPGEEDLEPTIDAEAEDDFSAAAPAAGGEEEAGREKRESKQYSKKKIAETSRRLATKLSKKK